MRPTYETEHDREREAEVGRYLSSAWDCQLFKLKPYYGMDFAVFVGGIMRGVMEIKCRNYTSEALAGLGGLILSAHKWQTASHWHSVHRMSFALAVRLADGLFVFDVPAETEWPVYRVTLAGRTDRGDDQDIEPCVMLPMSAFTRIDGFDQDLMLAL